MTPLQLPALRAAPAAPECGTTSHGSGGAVGGKDRDPIKNRPGAAAAARPAESRRGAGTRGNKEQIQ